MIVRRTQAPPRSLKVVIEYAQWVQPDGTVVGWTDNLKFADRLSPELTAKALQFCASRPVSGTIDTVGDDGLPAAPEPAPAG